MWSVEWCFQELQLLWALARARRLAVAIGRPELAPRRHGVEGDGGREVLAGGTASLYVLAMSVSVVPPSVLGSRAESVRGVL